MKTLFFIKIALEILITGVGFAMVIGAWIGGIMGLIYGIDAGMFGFKLFSLFFSVPAIIMVTMVKVKME